MSKVYKVFMGIFGTVAALAMLFCALYAFDLFSFQDKAEVTSRPDGQGNLYTGVLIDGVMEGQGDILYESGDRYVGRFVNGGYNGFGTYTAADGWSYEGEFIDGLPEGTGVFTDESGGVFSGFFEAGKITGEGGFDIMASFGKTDVEIDGKDYALYMYDEKITTDKKDYPVTFNFE